MARVYSRDQGKFIDQPDAGRQLGGYGAPTGGDGLIGQYGGGQDPLQMLLGMMAVKEGQPSAAWSILKPEKPSEAVEKAARAELDLDRRLKVVEKMWFPVEDKLAMPEPGNVVERKLHQLQKRYEASGEYELFRRQAKTLGAALAKAAGDTGNIAWAEQAAQLQALADTDFTKEEAEVAFTNMREALNISKGKRYFDELRRGEYSLDKLRQEAGITTDREYDRAPPITPTGAPPPRGQEIPYGALGQITGGFLPFPANIAAAGGIGGLGTAAPIAKERAGRVLSGDIPSYPEQVGESFTGMGQVGKTTGINALLQAILSPIKTFKGLRDVRAGASPLTVSGGGISRAAAETAKAAPAAEQVGATRTAQQALQRYGGQTLSAREALAAKAREWGAGYTAKEAGRGGAARVSRGIGGDIAGQIGQQDKFIALMDALQSILYRGKEQAGRALWRFGPWAAGAAGIGYGASRGGGFGG